MTTDINAIKAKIAKLLRMQTSGNANEAANAAAKVHQLCQEYGLSPDHIDPNADSTAHQPTHWFMNYMGKRRNAEQCTLLSGIVRYFNGRLIHVVDQDQRCCDVFASEGRRIEIEIYFEYLCETMAKQADEAREKEDPFHEDPTFKRNFRKGFAEKVRNRLYNMREEEQIEAEDNNDQEALVALSRGKQEQERVNKLVKHTYPRLYSGPGFSGSRGSGGSSGRAAGSRVGLNRQMAKGSSRQLKGY